MKIYCVDDEYNARKLLEIHLKKDMKYDVEIFSCPEETLLACEEELPDILITDIMMPNICGFKLAQLISDMASIKNKRVYIASLSATDINNFIGAEFDFDISFIKPINRVKMYEWIDSLII